MCFSKDERYLFAASNAGSIVVWDVHHQRVVLTWKEHLSQCTALSSMDNPVVGHHILVSGSNDTNIKIWDLRSKSSASTLRSHDKPITDVQISASANQQYNDLFLASSATDCYIKTWDFRSCKQISQLRHGSSSVQTLGILTNEKKLISGHSDRHLRIWDLNKSKIMSTTPSDSTVCQKLVSYGSKYILSGLND